MWAGSDFGDTNFLMVHGDLAPERGLELIRDLGWSHEEPLRHVVVHQLGPDPEYYLFDPEDLRRRLSGLHGAFPTLRDALDLDRIRPASVVDVSALAPVTPESIAAAAPHGALLASAGRIFAISDPGDAAAAAAAGVGPSPGGGGTRGAHGTRAGHGGIRSSAPAPAPSGGGPPGGEGPPGDDGSTAASVHRPLVAEFPLQVEVESVRSLLVSLGPESGEGLDVILAPGSDIQVIVVPKQGFTVEGDNEATLRVSGGDETLQVRFSLRALTVGPGEVRVLAFHGTESLGTLTLRPEIIAEAVDAVQHAQEAPLAPVSPRTPDLAIVILEFKESSEYIIGLTYALSNAPFLKFGPITLNLGPRGYFRDFFKEMEGLATKSQMDKDTLAARLAQKGSYLFEHVFPADLRKRLWEIRDSVQSVVIQSEEPWIPWELCKLSGDENGTIVDGPFLCERYEITRWLPGSQWDQLRLRNIALVAPEGSGLGGAAAEHDYLLSLADTDRKVTQVAATYTELLKGFA